MAQNLSNFDAVLKEDYHGPISEQLSNANIFMKRLSRNSEDVGGNKAIVPLHKTRNSGVGVGADGSALPTAGQQGYAEGSFSLAYNYGRIQVTGPVIAASRSNKYAFVKAVDAEIQGVTNDLSDNVSRQMFGDGSGVLCLANGDLSSGTTLTVDTPGSIYLQTGMKIQFVDPSSITAADYRANVGTLTVASVSSDTAGTVGASIHADAADNDYIVRANAYALEMMGIDGIISASNPRAGLYVGAINRSTAGNEFWKAGSILNSSTARALSLTLMQTAWDAAERAGGKISLIMTDFVQRRKYLALVKADGRFVNTLKMDGGYEALEYNGVPLVVDRYCLPGKIYFIDESSLAVYEASNIAWMEEDGAVLSRVSGYDAYEAVLYYYATMGCRAPNQNAVLGDLIAS